MKPKPLLAFAVAIAPLAFQLAGVISWPLWLVTLPLWLPVAALLLACTGVGAAFFVHLAGEERRQRRERYAFRAWQRMHPDRYAEVNEESNGN